MHSKISVLIPYYNEPEGLIRSLESLEYPGKLQIVIVDDGSKILYDRERIYRVGEGRYKYHLLQNERNKGIEQTLNKGLDFIYQELEDCFFVARLDCGDFCKNGRLLKQAEFLENNPEVHVVGSQVQMIDTKGNMLFKLKFPVHHTKIMKRMYINNMMCNGASMFRIRPIFEKIGGYPLDFPAAEDHAYFFRIGKEFVLSNLPEIHYLYEINPESISSLKRRRQVLSRIKLIRENFYFGYYPIYGLIRNFILLLFSRNLMTMLKKFLYMKNG